MRAAFRGAAEHHDGRTRDRNCRDLPMPGSEKRWIDPGKALSVERLILVTSQRDARSYVRFALAFLCTGLCKGGYHDDF
jgi:hypothetical protein